MSMSQAKGTVTGGEILGGGLALCNHQTTPVNTFSLVLTTAETLNSNQRLHFAVKADRTSAIRANAFATARAKKFEAMYIAHCLCHISFGDKRRRDPANYYPTIKACIDGFVDAGLLADDDHKHLIGPDMRIDSVFSDKGHVGFRFEFREVA